MSRNKCSFNINLTEIIQSFLDQHILIGSEEGIYTLSLAEIHDAVMDRVYFRIDLYWNVPKNCIIYNSRIKW